MWFGAQAGTYQQGHKGLAATNSAGQNPQAQCVHRLHTNTHTHTDRWCPQAAQTTPTPVLGGFSRAPKVTLARCKKRECKLNERERNDCIAINCAVVSVWQLFRVLPPFAFLFFLFGCCAFAIKMRRLGAPRASRSGARAGVRAASSTTVSIPLPFSLPLPAPFAPPSPTFFTHSRSRRRRPRTPLARCCPSCLSPTGGRLRCG